MGSNPTAVTGSSPARVAHVHQPAATGRPAERYLHPLQRTLQPMDGARSFQTPLQDACEALEWDCRFKSCRGQVCDNNRPFFGILPPLPPATLYATQWYFSKDSKVPRLLLFKKWIALRIALRGHFWPAEVFSVLGARGTTTLQPSKNKSRWAACAF